MRLVAATAMMLVLAGVGLLNHASKMPVYTDSKAPGGISQQLWPNPDNPDEVRQIDARADEWYARVETYETPYKDISDFGRGLCAAGAGILAGCGLWFFYERHPWVRKRSSLILISVGIWAVRVPLSGWYYLVRACRNDYPSWADSIAIPIFEQWFLWIVAAVVTSVILSILLRGRVLPDRIALSIPKTATDWIRAAFLGCLIIFLGQSARLGIADGDEGKVFADIMLIVIFLITASARRMEVGGEAKPVTGSDGELQVAG